MGKKLSLGYCNTHIKKKKEIKVLNSIFDSLFCLILFFFEKLIDKK